jgi:hypothetical protein
MLISFFKTPRHKRFNYKPLYLNEKPGSAMSSDGAELPGSKRIRFRRNSMVQAGSVRNLGGLRFAGMFAAILGLSGVLYGDSGWRQASLALLLVAGWVAWRLFASSGKADKSRGLIQGNNERD